jgi:hypothetical protein
VTNSIAWQIGIDLFFAADKVIPFQHGQVTFDAFEADLAA